jgi:hypothetical protein
MAQVKDRPQAPTGTRKRGGRRAGQGRWGSGPLQCTVCQHPARGRIDFAVAAGASMVAVGQTYGFAKQRISHHYKWHVGENYKKMVAAQHAVSFEELLKDVTECNAETIDALNLLIRGHMSRWAVCLETDGADHLMSLHAGKAMAALELRSKITLELQPETRNLTVNNYLVKDAASLVDVLRDNPAAVRQMEEWYSARMDRKLIEHDEVKGRAAAAD